MSFSLPSVKVKEVVPHTFEVSPGTYGVQDRMTHGFAQSKQSNGHPLAYSEKNYKDNQNRMNMTMLRNVQGLHAPIRMSMETRSAKKIGRLPFLTSSNAMLDSLTGRDLLIGPDDLFNTPDSMEVAGQPHAVVERSLGIL